MDARAYAGTYGGSPVVMALTAGDDSASVGAPADVATTASGPPAVPILAVHLDRPNALDGVHDRLGALEELAWTTGGTYTRLESPADLAEALETARLASGPRARLTIDLGGALTDPGPPPGSESWIELDLVIGVAGTALGLGGLRLPVLIR